MIVYIALADEMRKIFNLFCGLGAYTRYVLFKINKNLDECS